MEHYKNPIVPIVPSTSTPHVYISSRSSDLLGDVTQCGTPIGNWYWSRSSDLLGDVSDAARHAEKQLVLSRSLDLLGGARCAMLVRHAEKQLVSKILGEKKGR